MPLVVQKYGGSSLANVERIHSVARRIVATTDKGYQVVAVVSAMGSTTDKLIELAKSMSNMPSARELDLLLSTGELVSSTLLAMALKSKGLDAISLSGAQAGILTNSSHGHAKIVEVETGRVLNELEKGKTVVVAGFQGVTDQMDVTTLGRGASDTTAVAIAAGLNAERCEVFTDVDGIYTADPRIVPDARKLDEINFDEMLELASYGAKMAPRSIEMGMVYNVPIVVSSSFHENQGTLIHSEVNMKTAVTEVRNRVSGIATDTDVAKITVLGVHDRPGVSAMIFEPLAAVDISVDVIVQNASEGGETDLTFSVKRSELPRALEVVGKVSNSISTRGVVSSDNLAKVSIVGTGMREGSGYASRMFRILADNNVNIVMITTSEIRITCIIEESLLEVATKALHAGFELEKSDR
ncbi:MAG: aspartate kinase [Chloroflexota bacterium]|nr:aspartate kinase [Chloroflexota bacterium]